MLYCRIKCVPRRVIKQYVSKLVELTDLGEYADKPACSYSGGNRRKLQRACALCGNPDLLILDEVSAAVDPKTRRLINRLIKTSMRNRSCLITTHLMEEAESLCQRITIMIDGKAVCLGSLPHLKRKFASGLNLSVKVKDVPGMSEQFKQFVFTTFPGADVLEEHGVALRFSIVNASLSKVFRVLEQHKAQYLEAFVCGQATLESLFVSFATAAVDKQKAAQPHFASFPAIAAQNEPHDLSSSSSSSAGAASTEYKGYQSV
jgi:ATP-binding cassette subfamily A (ABC1) protein 3